MAFKFSRPTIWVFHQNKQNIVLINNWRIIWHTKIMSFLSFSDNLLQDAYIIFPKSVDNFAIAHKHAKFRLRCSTPLITQLGGRCIPIATLSFNLFIFINLSNKEVFTSTPDPWEKRRFRWPDSDWVSLIVYLHSTLLWLKLHVGSHLSL